MTAASSLDLAGQLLLTLPGVLGGILGAILGSLISGMFRYKTISDQITEANRRTVAQAYLEHRVEALNQLQRELHNCKRAYRHELENANPTTFTEDRYEAIRSVFEEFESAYDRVKIVFEEDEQSEELGTITAFYEDLQDINERLEEIRDQSSDRDRARASDHDMGIDIDEFEAQYERARDSVTSRLGQPLDDFSDGTQ